MVVGLVADNLRLRTALDEHQARATPEQRQLSTAKPNPSIQRRQTSVEQIRPEAPGPTDTVHTARALEAQIEEEVTRRLKLAVDQKIDTDLDSLVEARVAQRMDEQHDIRRERLEAMMNEYIGEFVADNDISNETEAALHTLIDNASTSLGDVFRSVHAGDLERVDARDEVQLVRDELAVSLEALLGEQDAEIFQEDLRGPLGRRWAARH